MDALLLLKFFSAFVFVIALMLLSSWLIKRLNLPGTLAQKGVVKRRLKVVEFLPVDQHRRLVLVRCDDREHLLLLGRQGEMVVAANLPADSNNIVELSRGQKNVQA